MTQPHSIKFPQKVLDFCEDAFLPAFNALRAAHGIEPASLRIGPPVSAEEARAAWDDYEAWEALRWGGCTPSRREAARLPNRFRERELARALRVAKREGGERVEIDPVTGRIVVTLAKPGGEPQAATDFDQWQAKRASKCELD